MNFYFVDFVLIRLTRKEVLIFLMDLRHRLIDKQGVVAQASQLSPKYSHYLCFSMVQEYVISSYLLVQDLLTFSFGYLAYRLFS
jgi:hypothetical protein